MSDLSKLYNYQVDNNNAPINVNTPLHFDSRIADRKKWFVRIPTTSITLSQSPPKRSVFLHKIFNATLHRRATDHQRVV